MERPKLQAQKRTITGRKVKKLRREGILPANLYGKNVKSLSLGVVLKDFQKIFGEVGETGLVDIKVDGESRPVLIHNVQLHPVTDEPLHIDFHQVSLTEKTTATVPISLVGESPAIEQKIGVLIQPLAEAEVEALPQDLPDRLVVDISGLKAIDDAVTVSNIQVDKKIEIKADPQEIVAKIGPLAKEEEVAPPPPAEGEEAVAEEGAPAEGEEVVEGIRTVEEKPATKEE